MAIMAHGEKMKNLELNEKVYRTLCIKVLESIRSLPLPKTPVKSDKTMVIVETRVLPHLEYLLRAFIYYVSPDWSLYFFTGNKEYHRWKEICSSISENIHVINLGVEELSFDQYSLLMFDPHFWNEIDAEYILVFQEDTCVFRRGIENYLQYDYVGAPKR